MTGTTAKDRGLLPEDREQWVFKPLYSFAGKGMQFASDRCRAGRHPARSAAQLSAAASACSFEPVIETPDGLTQAEIRIMYVWPDDGS